MIYFFPKIVFDVTGTRRFIESRRKLKTGHCCYRKARRVMPGIWASQGDAFYDWPAMYRPGKDVPKPRYIGGHDGKKE